MHANQQSSQTSPAAELAPAINNLWFNPIVEKLRDSLKAHSDSALLDQVRTGHSYLFDTVGTAENGKQLHLTAEGFRVLILGGDPRLEEVNATTAADLNLDPRNIIRIALHHSGLPDDIKTKG